MVITCVCILVIFNISFIELRYPFSLFSEARKARNAVLLVSRSGNVEECVVDKVIGRPVTVLKGTISVNNFIDYQELQLTGPYLYIQLSLMKPNVATLHLEIQTDDDLSFRISLSTLHQEVRFLCRQLRLPIPILNQGNWLIIQMHIDGILEKYCSTPNVKKLKMKCIKVCMLSGAILYCCNFIVYCSAFNYVPICW